MVEQGAHHINSANKELNHLALKTPLNARIALTESESVQPDEICQVILSNNYLQNLI